MQEDFGKEGACGLSGNTNSNPLILSRYLFSEANLKSNLYFIAINDLAKEHFLHETRGLIL